jgi:hypothetical protein
MADDVEPYRRHSRWTDPGRHAAWLRAMPPEPEALARRVPDLVMHCMTARLQGVPVPERALRDVEIRSVEELVDRVLARDPRAATEPRPPADRFFGVCSHFALLATSILRSHGVPARVRVGFARYFVPGACEDHWVVEYRDGDVWRLLDAQLDDASRALLGVAFPPWNVPREQFLDASTAWTRLRSGALDARHVGVTVVGLTGAWFAAQSVLRDVAALNRDEMLPWDTWGPGRQVGPHATRVPEQLTEGLDAVARTTAGSPDAACAAQVLHDAAWLRRTPDVFTLAFPTGWPNGTPTERTP